MWLDGGGINHQGGRGQGVLPVASGRTERGFSFSELDASGGRGDLNDLPGDADKSMTSSLPPRPPPPKKNNRSLFIKCTVRKEGA